GGQWGVGDNAEKVPAAEEGLFDLCRVINTKSVDNIQFLPFLAIKANNLCWLGYGCWKPDWTLIIINSIGAALQSLYILVYFYYSTTKAKVIRSRSTRCLSFPLTVTAFLASSSWTLYGQLVKDNYITVGWGQREAGGCCGFPPLLSSPFQRGAW
uniref:Sugar transporter SWEET1 n=1 Tax=Anas platyrhynchos platyrhynchos TaxID=8840 RepID=A0A493T5H2_ANAPP